MFNIFKGGEKNLDVFNKDTFKDNITILLNSPNKYEGLDSGTSGAIEDLLNLVKGITIPPFKKDTTLLKIFNNPYSIAKVLNESYDSATADRGDLFDGNRVLAPTSATQLLQAYRIKSLSVHPYRGQAQYVGQMGA